MELNRERMLGAYPATPEAVRMRVEATLSQIRQAAAKEPPKRYARRLSFAMALLVALLLAAIGVAAGLRFGVFDFMGRMFGASGVLPGADQLVQTDLARLELAHTELAVKEAVYDGGSLRVVYSLRQKDATAPLTMDDVYNPDSAFRRALAADQLHTQCDWFYIDGVEYGMTNGTAGDEVPGDEKGELLCYLDIQLSSAGIVPEGDFTVGLPLIGPLKAKQTIDFTVKTPMPPAELPSIRSGQATVTVLAASVSPVRTMVTVHIEMDGNATLTQYDEICADWRGAALTDGKGNELADLEELLPANIVEGKSIDYSYTFLPTDAEEVWLAPTIIDENNEWAVDMARGLKVK